MRFLFCSFSTPGYLFPLMGLAEELEAGGHRVAFASGQPSIPFLRAAGMERIPRGEPDGDSFHVGVWFDRIVAAIDTKHVEHAVARFHPDALVTHPLCQGAMMAGERAGLPTAVLGFFGYLWPTLGDRGESRAEENRRWRLGECVRIMNHARELFRLPALEPDDPEPLLGDLWMLRSVPRLVPELDSLPSQVHCVGACQWEPPSRDGGWSAIRAELADPAAPLVYAQPGRTFDGPGFWSQLVEALGDGPLQVVASTGRLDGGDGGSIPPNFLARPHVPQGVVVPRARLVLSSGSTSPVVAALAAGVPAVVLPSGGETPENASRLAAAGCALRLRIDRLTAAELRGAVERAMASTEMAAAARRLRRDFDRLDGFSTAAGLVERLAQGRSVPRAPAHARETRHAAASV
jgi:UDP:flavonoid glycosyltransferase YjiC (YdhE family)